MGWIPAPTVIHFSNLKTIKKVAAHTSYTPAPEFTTTVAPFRAWRGSQLVVAREPVQAAIDQNGW